MKERTFGQTVAALRAQHGMTQAELAEKMHVTDKAVSKWERNLSYPDTGSLPRLAEVLEVSLDELMRVPGARGGSASQEALRAALLGCKAVALAMGVSVVVLSALGQLDTGTGQTLLGMGLACAALALLWRPENLPKE